MEPRVQGRTVVPSKYGKGGPVATGRTSTNIEPMCDPRVRAWFEILEFDCSPDRISAHLNRRPTNCWRKGDLRPAPGRPYEEPGWRLASTLEDAMDLETHALWLLDQLPSTLGLELITASCYAQFTFVVETSHRCPSMAFQNATLDRIARLKAGVDIDFYIISADPAIKTSEELER